MAWTAPAFWDRYCSLARVIFFPFSLYWELNWDLGRKALQKGQIYCRCIAKDLLSFKAHLTNHWSEQSITHPTVQRYWNVKCQYNTALWFAHRFVLLPVKTSSLLAYSQTFSQRKQLVLSKAGSAGDSSIQSFTPMAAIHAASILAQSRTFFRQIVW